MLTEPLLGAALGMIAVTVGGTGSSAKDEVEAISTHKTITNKRRMFLSFETEAYRGRLVFRTLWGNELYNVQHQDAVQLGVTHKLMPLGVYSQLMRLSTYADVMIPAY